MSSGLEFEALLVGQDAAVDGVGDASFQAAAGLLDGLVFGDLSSVVVAAGPGSRAWVTAATWMAALSWRLPRLDNRCASCSPLDTSMGAVPA